MSKPAELEASVKYEHPTSIVVGGMPYRALLYQTPTGVVFAGLESQHRQLGAQHLQIHNDSGALVGVQHKYTVPGDPTRAVIVDATGNMYGSQDMTHAEVTQTLATYGHTEASAAEIGRHLAAARSLDKMPNGYIPTGAPVLTDSDRIMSSQAELLTGKSFDSKVVETPARRLDGQKTPSMFTLEAFKKNATGGPVGPGADASVDPAEEVSAVTGRLLDELSASLAGPRPSAGLRAPMANQGLGAVRVPSARAPTMGMGGVVPACGDF